jgi:hypothetical protein
VALAFNSDESSGSATKESSGILTSHEEIISL